MAKITFVDHEGERREVEVDSGLSVMEAATSNLVPGILADCGGACACATCHVILDEEWVDKVNAPSEDEQSMLEFVSEVTPTSRLSCQVFVADELDGLVVHTPEVQG